MRVRDLQSDWVSVREGSDQDAYELELGKLVEAQREKLKATAESLRQRGYLTESEVLGLSPRLVVTVKCDMEPCPLRSSRAC
jgi:hypothetical protein